MDLGLKIVGVDLVEPPEESVAGTGDQHLDIAEFLACPADEFGDRVGVGDIERKRHGLAAAAANGLGQFGALLDASGTQSNREPPGGQLGCGGGADPRRGAGDEDGPTVRVWFEARHQRSVTVIGSAENPRTLLECTRTALASSTS